MFLRRTSIKSCMKIDVFTHKAKNGHALVALPLTSVGRDTHSTRGPLRHGCPPNLACGVLRVLCCCESCVLPWPCRWMTNMGKSTIYVTEKGSLSRVYCSAKISRVLGNMTTLRGV